MENANLQRRCVLAPLFIITAEKATKDFKKSYILFVYNDAR